MIMMTAFPDAIILVPTNRLGQEHRRNLNDGDDEADDASDDKSDAESVDEWYFPIFEPLHIGVDRFKSWDYKGKDAAIYGYGGTKYLEGKESAKDLFLWYEKYGFIENSYLNTRDKYFSMVPLPSMELILEKYKMKKICQAFLENKCLK